MRSDIDNVPVNLFIALKAEAIPFIERFSLKKHSKIANFELYSNGRFQLMISGMGKENMSAAVALLEGISSANSEGATLSINAGIAGHQSLALNDTFMAQKIINQSSGVSFYPSICSLNCSYSDLITVDKPETDYLFDSGYDMEASAFAAIASKFTPLEFVQAVKTVSDNKESDINQINKQSIIESMRINMTIVEELIVKIAPRLSAFNNANRIPQSYSILMSSFHFSATQAIQLKKLCQRYSALGFKNELEQLTNSSFTVGKEVVAQLEKELELLVLQRES